MAFLICRFASSRSEPERIRRWITYLEEIRQSNPGAAEHVRLIDRLLSDANQWLQASCPEGDGQRVRGVTPARGAAMS